MESTGWRIARTALLVCGLSALLVGCGGSAGQAGRRTVEARGFTTVSTGSGIDVEVATSAGWAVEVSADRQVIDRIIVEMRESTLWIGLREGTLARARWLASQARVAIAMPSLDRLEASGGSQARLTLEQPGRDLAVVLSGGSLLSGSLVCAGFSISASGSSVAELSGSADRVDLVASDRSRLKLTGLETPSMNASLSGGSSAAVAVSVHLTVEASGGSGLSFRGDARVERQDLSGGSWLRKE
ncbi:MAG: DUF2807 domain-containing protein [Spirochaetes bacterium]|nr:DUF2807 domain-containing protein [Spirochaetota bacterium]